jgi:hypothetical protein
MFNRFLFIILIVNFKWCYSQTCLDAILQDRIYTKTGDIINGRQWINEKHYTGSPLLIHEYWPTGDIYYNGHHYSGLVMNYDLSREEMIIYSQENEKLKYVVISNEKLSGFTFTDTVLNRKRIYEYRELPGIRGYALYENASAGKILFYIKPIKKLELRTTGKGSGEYTERYEYYLNTGHGFARITSKGQLVRLLKDHGPELKRYMRDHSFRLSDRDPGNITELICYYDSLS